MCSLLFIAILAGTALGSRVNETSACAAVVASRRPEPIAVSINDANVTDKVGRNLKFELRLKLFESSRYKLQEEGKALLHINLISMDPDEGLQGEGTRTAVAFAVSLTSPPPKPGDKTAAALAENDLLLSHNLLIVGEKQIGKAVDGIITRLNDDVSDLGRSLHAP